MFKTLFFPFLLLIPLRITLSNYPAIALWHDEPFSPLLIPLPFPQMMHRIALDVHPPFYYWLLRIWSGAFGHSLSSLRGFSVLFGILTVAMLYLLVKSLTQNKKAAIVSTLLLAVNPFHIQYSLEARMYTLGTFLVGVSSWVIIRAIQTNKWRWWLLFALLTTASALTHYFLLFSIAAQGLFIFIWWFKTFGRDIFYRRLSSARHMWRWLGAYILSVILYLPWLPTFWKQFNQVQESYWIPKMDIWSIPMTLWKILIGGWQGSSELWLVAASIIVLILLVLYVSKYRGLLSWYIVFLGVVPFILAVLISLKTALFLDRYFIFASVFLVAIIALALLSLKSRIAYVLIGLTVIASLTSYYIGWQRLNIDQKPGMKAASAAIFENYPNDCTQTGEIADSKVVVSSTFIYFSYQYYDKLNKDLIREANSLILCPLPPEPKLYLKGIHKTSDLPHFSGTALLDDDDFVGDLNNFAGRDEQVFMLWTTGFGGNKPETPLNWQEVSEQKFPDVFAHRGDIFVTKYLVR